MTVSTPAPADLIRQVLSDPAAVLRARGVRTGHVGFDIPLEILDAAGGAAHLPWQADAPTPLADRWLESSFHPMTRSILDQWARGAFDALEQVVFTRGDDSIQRLYYYVCELQRRGEIAGPRPLIFDIARIPRASSRRHSEAAARRLSEQLGVTDDGLREAAVRTNALRLRLAHLSSGNTCGAGVEALDRASLFSPLAELDGGAALSGTDAPTILLAGSDPPDDRLHRMVEAGGYRLSAGGLQRSAARLGPAVDPDAADLAGLLGQRAHDAATGPRSFISPTASLGMEADGPAARAVLVWLIEEDEAGAWRAPLIARDVAALGLPCLTLSRQDWRLDDTARRDISDFLGALSR